MLNFKDKAVNDAIAEYGAVSENFRAARQEKANSSSRSEGGRRGGAEAREDELHDECRRERQGAADPQRRS